LLDISRSFIHVDGRSGKALNIVMDFAISEYVAAWAASPFANHHLAPWFIVQEAESIIRDALREIGEEYRVEGEFAVHRTATVEAGVILKGPGIVGARCFIAAGSYLRGGVYLAEDCIIGPSSELKSSFMFTGSKIAHLNFVGDSIIGSGVNIEAGAIIANYRNELVDKAIRIKLPTGVIETGINKFGALIGDNVRIGANAVVAPGALISTDSKIGRLQLFDQYPY
jgi:NDP-sugar pyrophosphorylase family protein